MAEAAILKTQDDDDMAGVKRDYKGNRKETNPGMPKDVVRNEYTDMFESFRDSLDQHHDRRQKIGKVSRDVTALSKKIIFSLQRVRKLNEPIPQNISSEIEKRTKEIKELLATIVDDVAGLRRYQYSMPGIEEFVEAVSFAHYLETQTLITPDQMQAALGDDVPILITPADYVYGIFDLTGEMMRFATAVTALSGAMPSGFMGEEADSGRTILEDLQETSSMLQIVPPIPGKGWKDKKAVMIEQVAKVERVGYGVRVRGNERPKGVGYDFDVGEEKAPVMD
ncbi:translin-associated X [Apiospora kogelbergensis]|uniref:Translin-associated X n=1 Tax=Apiospora kogelbergensis TaxID=1337665 RepID=A0AAW0RAX8_9PEZI